MAIEKLVEEYLKLEGYFTRTRVPFRTKQRGKSRGGLSDLDVIGVKPKKNDNIVVECKAFGKSDSYPNYASSKRKKSLMKYARKLVKGAKEFKKQSKIGSFKKYWIIIPGYLDDEQREQQERKIKGQLGKKVEIISIHKLIRDIIEKVEQDKGPRGRRYPDTALEMIRWMSRSFHHGRLGLADIGLALGKKKEDTLYPWLIRNFAPDVFRLVTQRGKDKHTRFKALESLLSLQDKKCKKWIERTAIYQKSRKLKYNGTGSGIRAGLGAWTNFGFVMRYGSQYQINRSYLAELKKLVK